MKMSHTSMNIVLSAASGIFSMNELPTNEDMGYGTAVPRFLSSPALVDHGLSNHGATSHPAEHAVDDNDSWPTHSLCVQSSLRYVVHELLRQKGLDRPTAATLAATQGRERLEIERQQEDETKEGPAMDAKSPTVRSAGEELEHTRGCGRQRGGG